MTPKQIRQAREALNLTRREFAEKLQYSVRTIEAWENGARDPSKRAVVAILRLKK